jgi:hypothetical protein
MFRSGRCCYVYVQERTPNRVSASGVYEGLLWLTLEERLCPAHSLCLGTLSSSPTVATELAAGPCPHLSSCC